MFLLEKHENILGHGRARLRPWRSRQLEPLAVSGFETPLPTSSSTGVCASKSTLTATTSTRCWAHSSTVCSSLFQANRPRFRSTRTPEPNHVPEMQKMVQRSTEPVYYRLPRSKFYVRTFYAGFALSMLGSVYGAYSLIRGKPATE
ncbi:hypothetical protein AcV7_003426 [Taiwanofungus camphoratus]|nr:hypothetical protein AcV7_003426 [Antrodia cinnamomea]